jgi:glycosyltransferase involved in cell wall biosynthesis
VALPGHRIPGMRIMHVSQPVEAGVPRVVVDLAADQVGRGWDVVVVSPDSGWLPEAARGVGARHVPWNASRSPGPATLREAVTLAAIVRRTSPSVVHLHSSKAGLAGRLAVRGRRPTAFQPHAWSFEATEGVVGRASATWERWAGRWTNLVVAVSEDEAALGRDIGLRAPLLVVPNGVDPRRWVPQDRHEARTALGMGVGPVVVCVGRLARQKGQDLLVQAWPAVRDRVPGARLVLVGEGPERTALQGSAGPGVELVGATEDPSLWYAAADVVAMPSRWEGMALVALEAMACGRPVVATAVSGALEAIGTEAGAVIPVEDAAALGEALVRRLRDPHQAGREGDRARARVLRHFDVRVTAALVGDAVAGLAMTSRSA